MIKELWKYILVLIVVGIVYCVILENTERQQIHEGFVIKNAILER